MKKKLGFYTEIAFFLGLAILAFGTSMTKYGGGMTIFGIPMGGMSMVVAPVFIIADGFKELFNLTIPDGLLYGITECLFQAIILALTMIVMRKAKLCYLLSFAAAVIYSGILTLSNVLIFEKIPVTLPAQIVIYILGVIFCCAGIALLLYGYFPPEAYEMFVKEISAKFKKPISIVKIFYDCGSLVLSLILCLVFWSFGNIGVGTIVCAFLNGILIGLFQKLYSKIFNFKDKFKLRKYFEESEK